jgi:hypothetical protein
MTKSLALLIIISALPSYFALYCSPTYASIILCVSTFFGAVITGVATELELPNDRAKLGWLIHIIGIMVVVFVKNVIQ